MAKLILNPRFLDDRLEPTIENATAVLEGEVFAFMFELEGTNAKPVYVVFSDPKRVAVSGGTDDVRIVQAYLLPPVFERMQSKVSGGHGTARFCFINANVVFMPVGEYDQSLSKGKKFIDVDRCLFIYDDRKGEFVKEGITMDELRASYGLRCILPKDLGR